MRRSKFYKILKALTILVFSLIFIGGGVNHLVNPAMYYPIMPPYLRFPVTQNILAGVAELIVGLGMIFPRTRKDAAYGAIILLIIFFTVHIYMLQMAPMELHDVHFTPAMAWGRIVLQFLLIFIAWLVSRQRFNIFTGR